MAGLTKRLFYYGWVSLASLVIVLALLITSMRLLLPFAEEFRGEVELWAGDILGQAITIEGLQSHWGTAGPVLSLQGVTLKGQNGSQLLRLDEARIGIDFFGSIVNRSLLPDEISLVGGRFSVLRRLDGSHQLAGLAVAGDEATSTDAGIAKWLFSRAQIQILDSEIHWRDERVAGDGHLFQHVNLHLRNQGGRHQLDVTIAMPGGHGEMLRIAADLQGNPLSSNQWQGQVYLKGQGLSADLLRDMGEQDLPVTAKRLDLELWGEWHQARLKSMEGQFNLTGVQLTQNTDMPTLGLSGQFRLEEMAAGWRLFMPALRLKQALRSWAPMPIDIHYLPAQGEHAEIVRANIARLRVDDVMSVVKAFPGLAPEQREAIDAMMPAGVLDVVQVELQLPGQGRELNWQIKGRMADLTTAPWRSLPGVDGLSGAFYAAPSEIIVDIDSRDAWADSPRLFRQPLFASELQGQVYAVQDNQGWRVSAPRLWARNDDITTLTDLQVMIPTDGVAWMDLQSAYRDGDVMDAHLYYPVGIMGEGLLDWLEGGLVDGRLTEGDVLFRGPFNAFPFSGNEGRFEVLFQVSDFALDYQRDWPGMQEVNATVHFDQMRLEIEHGYGRIFDTALKGVEVVIPDLTQDRRIYVTGETQGSATNALTYVRQSPLSDILGGIFDPVTGTGNVAIGLELQIPLQGQDDLAVNGQISLQGNGLNFTQWSLPLEQVTGVVDFTELGVASEGVSGRLFEGEVAMSARRVRSSEGQVAQSLLDFSGTHVAVGPLATGFNVPFAEYLSGHSAFQGSLQINHGLTENGVAAAIRFSSDMLGAVTDLPEPMYKSAVVAWPLEMEFLVQRDQNNLLSVDIQDRISTRLEFTAEPTRLWRGAIRLGDAVAELPDKTGLWVSGNAATISIADWQPIVMKAMDESEGGGQLWQAVDVSVKELKVPGLTLHDADISLRVTPLLWSGEFSAQEGGGKISWSRDLSMDIPVTLRMGRLVLPPRPDGEVAEDLPETGVAVEPSYPDPRRIPSLYLTIDQLYRGDALLGALHLETRRSGQGQQINTLTLKSQETQWQIEGDWVVQADEEQRTRLKLSLKSKDFGDHLSALGYPSTLSNGSGRIEGEFFWSAPPYCWSPESLGGRVTINLSDGRVIEAQPGAGRLLGLLSLYTLPRRLMLDFSDLFGKGLTFDSWKGEVEMSQGLASTDKMVIDGPAARISFQGDADLLSREVDQTVEMLPRISGTLPLWGAITGGTAGGVFMLVFESIFGESVNKSAKMTYQVSGSWDNPEVVDLVPPKPPEQAVESESQQ